MVCQSSGLPSALGKESSCSSSAPPCSPCPCLSQSLQLDPSACPPSGSGRPTAWASADRSGKVSKAKRPTQVLPFRLGYLCCLFHQQPWPQTQTWRLGRSDCSSMRSLLLSSVEYAACRPAPFSRGRPHCLAAQLWSVLFSRLGQILAPDGQLPSPCWQSLPLWPDTPLIARPVIMTKTVAPWSMGTSYVFKFSPCGWASDPPSQPPALDFIHNALHLVSSRCTRTCFMKIQYKQQCPQIIITIP